MQTAICPICHKALAMDEAALIHHINAHFDAAPPSPAESSSSRPRSRSPERASTAGKLRHRKSLKERAGMEYTLESLPERSHRKSADAGCFICGYPFMGLDEREREVHVNNCLDGTVHDEEGEFDHDEWGPGGVGQRGDDDSVEADWDGPAKPGGWSDWVNRKVDRGDRWWDPVQGPFVTSAIPPNMTPSLHPVLTQILILSSARNATARAALSLPAVHIKSVWTFDAGWGCGYRNALMALSALLMARPEYRGVFSRQFNGAEPGVRRMQGWIEEAWGNGYDRDGRDQLRGKVLGTRKWIGTSDLYATFTNKGIPCELYDFPESSKSARPSNVALLEWVKEYFTAEDDSPSSSSGQPKPKDAYAVLMRPSSSRGTPIRQSTRLPLILQHSGHSRTIIGYEETPSGSINLLLFDPGRSIPKDIRAAAMAEMQRSKSRDLSATRAYKTDSRDELQLGEDEVVDEGGWVRKKVGKVLGKRTRSPVQVHSGGGGSGGGARKPGMDGEGLAKWSGDVSKAMGYFRANMAKLSSHGQYQVLAFTGGPLLSEEQRAARKKLTSTVIR